MPSWTTILEGCVRLTLPCACSQNVSLQSLHGGPSMWNDDTHCKTPWTISNACIFHVLSLLWRMVAYRDHTHSLSLSLSKLSTLSFLYGKPICGIHVQCTVVLLTSCSLRMNPMFAKINSNLRWQVTAVFERTARAGNCTWFLPIILRARNLPAKKKTRTRLEQVKWSKHEPFWFGGFGESCRVFHQYVQHVGMQCPTARRSPEILAKSLWIFLFFEPPPVSQ